MHVRIDAEAVEREEQRHQSEGNGDSGSAPRVHKTVHAVLRVCGVQLRAYSVLCAETKRAVVDTDELALDRSAGCHHRRHARARLSLPFGYGCVCENDAC